MSRKELFEDKTVEEVFTLIYDDQIWKSADDIDSISGSGSTLKFTKNFRKELPIVFKDLNIKRLLDLGCGDLVWFKDLLSIFDYYLGVDIVPQLILANKNNFKDDYPNANFQIKEIAEYEPDKSFDAVLVKDVFVHLNNNQISKTLTNLKKANIKYLIATNFPVFSKNVELEFWGDWRPINFELEPFNLGSPLVSIREPLEFYDFNGVAYNDKSLSVWEIK